MSYYQPDVWVVIKLTGEDPHYRVLGGWHGGYLGSDSWRLNSGVTKVEKGSTTWKFYGSSGSCYECGMHNYRMSVTTAEIYERLQRIHGNHVSLMNGDTEWLEVKW